MIDEEKTFREKGYRSTDLSHGSNKEVWRVCDECREGRWLQFAKYRSLCKKCSLKGNTYAVGNKPNKTAFKSGTAPWNKNVKGIHLSPETEFKKGQRPINWLPVGTITKRKNERETHTRQFIKIDEPNKWEEYAKYVWNNQYGSLIKGDVIYHINGDTLDDRIENLIALPRKDHPKFHGGNKIRVKKITDAQLRFYKSRYEHKSIVQTQLF